MSKAKRLLERAKAKRQDLKDAKELLSGIEVEEEELMRKLQEEDVDELADYRREPIQEAGNLTFTAKIVEKDADPKKRTVIAGVLQENALSANKRFYPAQVVREAIEGLQGVRSLIGHDTNNPEDVVARITNSYMKEGIGYAEFKFGGDDKSLRIFNKINEGLLDSTSIRASGQVRRGKVNGEYVDVVESLDIASVDWVVQGGVAAAKVAQVFEEAPEIVYEDKNKEDKSQMEEVKKLQEQLAEQKKQLDALIAENKEAKSKIEEKDSEILASKLKAHVEEKLATLSDKDDRDLVRDHLSADSVEELDKQFDKAVSFIKSIKDKAGIEEDVIVKPKAKQTEKEFYRNYNSLLEDANESHRDRAKVLAKLMG